MERLLAIAYGAVGYVAGLVAFGYAIGFVGNIAVPHSIDHGLTAPVGQAVVIDVFLLSAFGVQHSVMARPGFKRRWTKVVPQSIERSTYVSTTALVMFLLFWQWRTMPAVVWDVSWRPGSLVLQLLFWLGWATVMINHFDLFGLRQVYLAWRGEPYTDIGFRTPLLYRLVRHPLLLGFIVAFWAGPAMTAGHLLFAVVMTGYILIAVRFEERDLTADLGDQYRDYRRRVPRLVPCPRRRRVVASSVPVRDPA